MSSALPTYPIEGVSYNNSFLKTEYDYLHLLLASMIPTVLHTRDFQVDKLLPPSGSDWPYWKQSCILGSFYMIHVSHVDYNPISTVCSLSISQTLLSRISLYSYQVPPLSSPQSTHPTRREPHNSRENKPSSSSSSSSFPRVSTSSPHLGKKSQQT